MLGSSKAWQVTLAAVAGEIAKAAIVGTAAIGEVLWLLGLVVWCGIRYAPYRRARRTATVVKHDRNRERILLAVSFIGMFVLPLVFAATGEPRFANYRPHPAQIVFGALVLAAALWVFRCTHKELGRNWSATLEVRESHTLITTGIYRSVRHPMYAGYWLWTAAQALLIANWIAGPAGILSFALHFFMRVGREEQMLRERFGEVYLDYAARTSRIIPGLY
jgi:protein-S-isoprenylcysteine O-methyltransferase Ste14